MDYLALKYTLKEGSVKEPEAYLGAEIRKWTIDGLDDPTKVRWAMSSDLYVERAVTEVEREVSEINMRLVTTVSTPRVKDAGQSYPNWMPSAQTIIRG